MSGGAGFLPSTVARGYTRYVNCLVGGYINIYIYIIYIYIYIYICY